ncbi:MAG TPA: hypothetical protein VG984_01325 [Candidatus Paceibacterota bacterium]|nr:hypothetical protein [Candidatus Paceibacterota bacterium]
MNLDDFRDLPDVTKIIDFSKRFPKGVSKEEAENFLRREMIAVASLSFKPPFLAQDPRQKHDPRGLIMWVFLEEQGHLLLNKDHLDFLLENQQHIPQYWETIGGGGAHIFFWGGVAPSSDAWIPSMFFSEGKWKRVGRIVSQRWGAKDYAAVYIAPQQAQR